MDYILGRLREPSTWAGIAGILGALHLSLDPGLWQNISTAGMALAGIVAALVADRSAALSKQVNGNA